ncbi:MAG TPA: hypothetical protein VMV07_17225 [Streptosporangiaceae bacterium]|nr:hypothetical protein [Streptosporangiaceae bacterium]
MEHLAEGSGGDQGLGEPGQQVAGEQFGAQHAHVPCSSAAEPKPSNGPGELDVHAEIEEAAQVSHSAST